MARSNYRTKALATANKTENRLHPALANLKERLSSPRLKAKSTILTYLETSARFLSSLGKDREPAENDFRRYFIRRQRQGISERTLRKEFVQLKKLAIANSWSWPFGAEGASEIAPRRKRRTKALATAGETVSKLHPAIENLVERLPSSRLGAPSTLASYLATGTNFLSALKDNRSPTDGDFRRYFIQRRQMGISESTLRKEFFHLKKLALANGWPWPFESDDAPNPEQERKLPAFSRADVEQSIKARAKLSKSERFYLAVATTWIVRREELSKIKKRDYDDETFIIHTNKPGNDMKHLIPDAIKPIFAGYRPKEYTPSALSLMFRRICTKAGLEQKRGSGWDSIRDRLNALLKDVSLPQNNLNPSLLDDYAQGRRKASGRHEAADMTPDYSHHEILDTDPHGIDKVVYSIHPFLPLWQKKR